MRPSTSSTRPRPPCSWSAAATPARLAATPRHLPRGRRATSARSAQHTAHSNPAQQSHLAREAEQVVFGCPHKLGVHESTLFAISDLWSARRASAPPQIEWQLWALSFLLPVRFLGGGEGGGCCSASLRPTWIGRTLADPADAPRNQAAAPRMSRAVGGRGWVHAAQAGVRGYMVRGARRRRNSAINKYIHIAPATQLYTSVAYIRACPHHRTAQSRVLASSAALRSAASCPKNFCST